MEIRALLRNGSRRRCDSLDLFRGPARAGRPRAGIIVPRYGNSIVARNKLKRRLRECVRTTWLPGASQGEGAEDMLLRARPEAYDASFEALLESVRRCAESSS